MNANESRIVFCHVRQTIGRTFRRLSLSIVNLDTASLHLPPFDQLLLNEQRTTCFLKQIFLSLTALDIVLVNSKLAIVFDDDNDKKTENNAFKYS